MANNDWKSRLNVVYSTNPDFKYDTREDDAVQTLPPDQQELRVWLDRKARAGKQVTLVKGFIGSDDDLRELAGMLKIKPILEVSKNSGGKVGTCEKVRTMAKAISKAAKLAAKGAKEAGYCVYFVVDSAAEENAKMCVDELRALIGPDHEIQREPICAVIASHTGLGSVAFQYCKKVKGAD